MNWAYGITTVPSRRWTLLPQTLGSLANAGFDSPRLFVDGAENACEYYELGLPLTIREKPNVGNFANWWLAFHELFVRNPTADRFAIFEDDMLACRNLREYLSRLPYPENGYINLYSFPVNERMATSNGLYRAVFQKDSTTMQRGLGAVGLVFSRDVAITLMKSESMVRHPLWKEGKEKVDGAIVNALNLNGVLEYAHNPGLIQHTGDVSTLRHGRFPKSKTFPGEHFDALSLLSGT